MFGLSFWEIGIILAVALIILGPSKLPELARSLGKGLREFRKATEDFKSTVNDEAFRPEATPAQVPGAPAAALSPPAGGEVAAPEQEADIEPATPAAKADAAPAETETASGPNAEPADAASPAAADAAPAQAADAAPAPAAEAAASTTDDEGDVGSEAKPIEPIGR